MARTFDEQDPEVGAILLDERGRLYRIVERTGLLDENGVVRAVELSLSRGQLRERPGAVAIRTGFCVCPPLELLTRDPAQRRSLHERLAAPYRPALKERITTRKAGLHELVRQRVLVPSRGYSGPGLGRPDEPTVGDLLNG